MSNPAEEEPNDTLMRAKLQDISNEIRISYLQDTDKTNEMKKAIQFINNKIFYWFIFKRSNFQYNYSKYGLW